MKSVGRLAKCGADYPSSDLLATYSNSPRDRFVMLSGNPDSDSRLPAFPPLTKPCGAMSKRAPNELESKLHQAALSSPKNVIFPSID